jgi:hypothetical protein
MAEFVEEGNYRERETYVSVADGVAGEPPPGLWGGCQPPPQAWASAWGWLASHPIGMGWPVTHLLNHRFLFLFFNFFPQNDVIFRTFFKLIFFFPNGHFSNLTSKNEVVLYFPSNLMVLTNGGGQNTTVW